MTTQAPGRPSYDIDDIKDQIIGAWLHQPDPDDPNDRVLTIDALLEFVREYFGISISRRTLARRLQAWGVRKYTPQLTAEQRGEIVNQIENLLFRQNKKDKDAVTVLQDNLQVQITLRKFQEIRRSVNIYRRTNPETRTGQRDEVRNIISKGLDQGKILYTGSRSVKQFLHTQGYIVPRYANHYLNNFR
jgi:hypothetical protein